VFLAIISWGYSNIDTSRLYLLAPLGYGNTLEAIYYVRIIKNIAFWPYKEIPSSPNSRPPNDVGYSKTHVLDLANVYILERCIKH
jgi:hypothetical protein